MDIIASAIHKCPFLSELAVNQGNDFARHIATQPTKPAGTCPGRPLLEEVDCFYTTFNLFHGKSGLVPLQKPQLSEQSSLRIVEQRDAPEREHVPSPSAENRQFRPPMFASMTLSMGAMPDPGKGRPDKNKSNKKNHHYNIRQNNRIKSEKFKPLSASAASGPGPAAGGCPLRQWLGPLAPVVFNAHGKLQCPEVIIQMRAALSRTAPVRQLRPKGLPIKLVAVGATAALVNVPCGAIREHFDKFSVGWFLAVHASIPFVAMLRKAVVMPKFAIAMTVAAAIAGQVFGSRMERYRLEQVRASQDQLTPLTGVDRMVLVRDPMPAQQLAPAAHQAADEGNRLQKTKTLTKAGGRCPLKDLGVVKDFCSAQEAGNGACPTHSAHATHMFAHVSVPIRVA